MFELISRNPSRYYLAYGSNLDMERMGKRCPYAVVVGSAITRPSVITARLLGALKLED